MTEEKDLTPKKINFKLLGILSGVILFILLLAGVFMWYSPTTITYPKLTHYHLRIQILIDGKAENFADSKYQTPYAPGLCSADLPTEPIHFHDDQDQILHLHWNKITGGEFLKYYGWNKIGGLDNSLGFRLDKWQNVPIHGQSLPKINPEWNNYIYIGDATNYQTKNFNDFLTQDFETFIGKKSRINQEFEDAAKEKQSLIPNLVTPVLAHETGTAHSENETKDGVNLEELNDLLGNIVIFTQKDEPTKEQIQDRFNQLVKLPNSTCGG